ncbi:MAG: recombinase family protein [Pseudomonadota bacterium]
MNTATTTLKRGTAVPHSATKAIIYCRVSSKKQSAEGSGLESQEHRCRQYAEARGYEVEAVFPDDASGGGDFMNRPGMVALLAYLEARRETDFVIVFDDLKRFSRDIEFHKKLRRTLDRHGATPECLNFRFEDTPEGEFVETIIAAQGELERKQNRRQVIQKMSARLERGYAVVSQPPRGYRYERMRGHGRVLVRDEPLASVVQEALEGYASGRFRSQGEVKRFLDADPAFPKPKSGEVLFEAVKRMLTQPLYAGYVEAPNWGISRRKGQRDGLIDLATFEKIQQRLSGTANAPARKDIGSLFALRGFVTCADCERPLYSSQSRGRHGGLFAYYACHTKGCESYGKSIRRDKLEGDFEQLLKAMRPTKGLLTLVREMFLHAWELRRSQVAEMRTALRREIAGIEKQIDGFLDNIADAASTTTVRA